MLNLTPMVPAMCKVKSRAEIPELSMAKMFSRRCFQTFQLDVRTSARLASDRISFQHLLWVKGAGVLTRIGKEGFS